ncbi:hypothetical protein M569_14527 [Genlisea aurea]|uniref:Maintenance of Photosystem II under High light 2 C-terminal domain-containing protein n=1 Tax=Genlisea aurea TaxID=192259 RepID=S8C791_9LAMI|nr:hypothetical protein M569_14527 [Genlisea aurea]
MALHLVANAKLLLPSPPAAVPVRIKQPAVVGECVCRRSIFVGIAAALILKRKPPANAAVLEAEDDVELLEKVKKDRKKRIDRQGLISSSAKETGYLQDLVYKLSRVGQAIEGNDLSQVSSVLGRTKDSEWLQNVNAALSKFSSSEEEKTEVDAFNSSLASLISFVSGNDIESSKVVFVESATAFVKWAALSGLGDKLKGL